MFLMIQNPGEAPIEGFTLLGASGSRHVDAANGQFGTGNKLAVTLLLRKGYQVRVYSGKDRLEFGTRIANFEGKAIERVTCSINGRKATDCGWTLSWGSIDWTDTPMALREFVANALDASIKGRGYAADLASGDLKVGMVERQSAKAGFTRVFIKQVFEGDMCALTRYLDELPQRFLHFSEGMDQEILPKANRSLDKGQAMVYRMGVFVCQLDGDSVYDYNLGPDQIKIDECRNSNEYSVRAAIARRIRRATADELVPIFKAIGAREPVLESKLDPDYLLPSWETPRPGEIDAWQNAWKQVFADAVMTDSNERSLEFVQKKGYRAQSIDSGQWRLALGRLGIKSDSDVLSAAELKGRVPVGAPGGLYQIVDSIWSQVKVRGLSDKKMPLVGCFQEDEDTASCDVYVANGTVFVREDLAADWKVCLAGVAEYATGAPALTTKFQDFAFELAASLLKEF